MGTEYRLVTVKPGESERHVVYLKRSYDHARKGLVDWVRDMERYEAVGIAPWTAHIETREVSDWEAVDFTTPEAVPI